MVRILNDLHPSIGKAITDLISLIEKYGGFFDIDLEIHCRDSGFSIHKKGGITNNFIIQIPEALLLPIEDFSLSLVDDYLFLTGHKSETTTLRLEIIQILIEIYNLTQKIRHYRTTCPLSLEFAAPDIYKILTSGRRYPSFERMGSLQNINPVVYGMLKTRTMQYRRADSNTNQLTEVIMPVIDFLNHHPVAPVYIKSADQTGNNALSARGFCPDPTTGECFVRYGIFDSYDAFLRYGYVERHSQFVTSIPMKVDIPGLGYLTIRADNRETVQVPRKEFAGLSLYFPAYSVDRHSRSAVLGYLRIPQQHAPFALRRVLGIVIHEIEPNLTITQANSIVESLEPVILSRNMDFYQNLYSNLQEMNVSKLYAEMIQSAIGMTQIQLKKLQNYPFYSC